MINKTALSLGLAVLLGTALCASARQPKGTNEPDSSSVLQRLLELAQDPSAGPAPNSRETTLAMDRATLKPPNADTSMSGAGAESQTKPGVPALQRRNPRYRVETGDALSIQFSFVPEFNQAVKVQPDGYVSLREVDDLHVQGLTTPEITERVRQKYSKILHDPVVMVTLTDFEKPYFIVGGQVTNPGKFDLRGDTTVSEAIQVAGGFTERSKDSQVLLFRKVSSDWVETKKLNLKEMLRAGNLTEDLHLQPGDMLYVPQNTLSKIQRFLPIPHPGIVINPRRF